MSWVMSSSRPGCQVRSCSTAVAAICPAYRAMCWAWKAGWASARCRLCSGSSLVIIPSPKSSFITWNGGPLRITRPLVRSTSDTRSGWFTTYVCRRGPP